MHKVQEIITGDNRFRGSRNEKVGNGLKRRHNSEKKDGREGYKRKENTSACTYS